MVSSESAETAARLAGQFGEALACHKRGEFERAASLYLAVLAADPRHFETLLHLGIVRLQQGQAEEAARLISNAVVERPDSAEAHSNLAAALQACGELDQAVASYDAALSINPTFEACYGVTTALQALGRRDEAAVRLQQALAVAPDSAEAHYGLATALQSQNSLPDAVRRYELALALDPDFAEASYGIATALTALEKYREAIPHLEHAIHIDPDYADAHRSLGHAYRKVAQYEEAVLHFRRVLALEPNDAHTLNNLGVALHNLLRFEEARTCFDRALVIDPNFAAAHANRGLTYGTLGRLDEARGSFEMAIALDPGRPKYYRGLTDTKKISPGDPILAALEELARGRSRLPIDEQIELHFALGKALSDTGQRERSFQHLLSGNALKRQIVPYDEAGTLRLFGRIAEIFTPEFMRQMAGKGDPSELPVFVFGMPRSGTTLTEQVLASHPDVFAAGERMEFNDCVAALGASIPPRAPYPHFLSLLALAPSRLRELASSYLAKAGGAVPPAVPRMTDKMPANFRYAGLIHLAFPKARLIHVSRDPIDTCLSCFGTLFTDGNYFAYELGELGRYYRAYQEVMAHWRRVLPEGTMLEVRYEDLVTDFEPQARRIVDFCGLAWDPACLAFHQTDRPVRTASFAQVRQPIYQSSVGRWRPSDALLRPLLEGLAAARPFPRS